MTLKQYLPGFVRQYGRRVRQTLRQCVRAIVPVQVNELLPASGCRASVELLKPIAIVEKGDFFICPVRVRNLGDRIWSSHGRHPVMVIARWLTSRKQPLAIELARSPLPVHVGPGEEVIVHARVPAPESLGHYLVEFDLLQEPALDFREYGSAVALMDCQVTGRVTDDIDYHKAYATADLNRDYWTVVGPSTREEYDRLSKVKLQHLIELGLTPDSRLLDVGCGTGLLTNAVEPYLSANGLYFGTDLGKEAIEHCKHRFTRPNFHFAQNEMTRIPITDQQFDMICYYSVFTHTYPDETALLLAESKRLLAPNGAIFADVFTSPLVDRYSGNRGAVEVNEEHLMRLIALVGLKAELVMAGKWQQYGERKFYRFTHA